MNGRQPFYHRNADVDEISYQACGERTLMTELGTVELRSGDFSRIPVSVAHDNYGREDVHLLFYTLAPAVECGRIERSAEHKKVPFEGWTPALRATEMMTECLGTPGCDIAVSLVDEQLLLDEDNGHARGGGNILVQRARGGVSESVTEWLYKSKWVWVGMVRLDKAAGTVYHRHRRANAIHCQIQGSRTIVTQRGTALLEPGDFINVPRGCAYTSTTSGESFHIVILSTGDVDLKAEVARRAEPTSLEQVRKARADRRE